MSFEKSSSADVLLQRIKYEIFKAGAGKEIAYRIGTRRGWRTHPDMDRQLRRWLRNVNQMLDGLDCKRTWSLLDHLDAVAVLGFDPMAAQRVAA